MKAVDSKKLQVILFHLRNIDWLKDWNL